MPMSIDNKTSMQKNFVSPLASLGNGLLFTICVRIPCTCVFFLPESSKYRSKIVHLNKHIILHSFHISILRKFSQSGSLRKVSGEIIEFSAQKGGGVTGQKWKTKGLIAGVKRLMGAKNSFIICVHGFLGGGKVG